MEDDEIELLVLALIGVYRQSLLKGVTNYTLEAYLKAATDLNTARENTGLEVLPIEEKKLTEDALKQVESWYSDLVKKGGSNVVVDHDHLEFNPWLSNLESELKLKLQNEYNNIDNADKIGDVLSNLKTGFYESAGIAAFYEIYRNADAAKKNVWKEESVIRHAYEPNICPECDELDGQVFKASDAPPLPAHPRCKCEDELIVE